MQNGPLDNDTDEFPTEITKTCDMRHVAKTLRLLPGDNDISI
jgi:hypothetical protein